jgi:hypothetical protein
VKKLTQVGLLLALILGFSSYSQAALLIEPVVGYNLGKSNFKSEVPSDPSLNDSSSDSLKGASYGGRLGYQNLGFQLGVDYLASNLDIDGDEFKTTEWAGFIGFEFPILLRVYAGYIFSGTGKTEDDFKFEKGTGPKFGVGFTILPFLDLNVEYRKITYDTYEGSEAGTDFKIDTDYSAIMVGISLPFTL